MKKFNGPASSKVRDQRPPTEPSDHPAGGFRENPYLRGFVGGEVEGAPGRGFGDVGDWDGDESTVEYCTEHYGLPIAHDGISDHFLQQRYLRRGHNDGPGPTDANPRGDGWANPLGLPEKNWSDQPQREEDEKVPSIPIRGGGARPF